jgi:hypothetical protein
MSIKRRIPITPEDIVAIEFECTQCPRSIQHTDKQGRKAVFRSSLGSIPNWRLCMGKFSLFLLVILILAGTSFCADSKDDFFLPSSCVGLTNIFQKIDNKQMQNCVEDLMDGIRQTRRRIDQSNYEINETLKRNKEFDISSDLLEMFRNVSKESKENNKNLENLETKLLQIKDERYEHDRDRDSEIESLKNRIIELETALGNLKNEVQSSKPKATVGKANGKAK